MSDDPDFDVDLLTEFFDALYAKDQTDKYADPKEVDVKVGFYYAYDIISSQTTAVKEAREANEKAKTEEAKKPVADQKKPKTTMPTMTDRTVAKTPVKVDISVPGGDRTFKIPMKYAVRYADAVIKLDANGDWDVADYVKRLDKAKPLAFHLTVSRTMGDAVHDTNAELARCLFPWHDALAQQSASGRKDFAKNLKDITFVPTQMADADSMIAAEVEGSKEFKQYWSTVGMQFSKTLASTCTYDGQGDYFGKWTADAIKKKNFTYIGPNLNQGYLIRATAEYELEQGYNYALMLSPVMQRLYRVRQKKGVANAAEVDLLMGLDRSKLIPPAWDTKYDQLPRPMLLYFWAAHGLPHKAKPSGVKMPSYYRYTVKQGAFRRLADCEREVRGEIGDDAANSLRAKNDFDWFVELAKLRFTDTLYTIDITRQMELSRTVGGADPKAWLQPLREKLVKGIAPDLWEWAGNNPIRLESLKLTQKWLENPNLLVLQQGMQVNDKVKFVGIHDGLAYVRNIETDVTFQIPVDALVAEMAEDTKYLTFYKNSEGVIYYAKIVVWGGLAVIALAILAPAALSAGTMYRVVAQRVRGYISGEAIRQVMIFEIPALAAGLAWVIASLFEEDYPKAKQWKLFAQGFFEGYAINTLKKIFMEFDAENIAKAVLKEYYLYKRLKQLHHTVKVVSAKFHELTAKLDKNSVTALVEKFEQAAKEAMRGALVLFQLISYLEHSDASDILGGVSGMLGALEKDPLEALQKNEFYAEAKEFVIDGVVTVGQLVDGKGKAVFDAAEGVFNWVEEHENWLAAAALGLTVARIAKTMTALKSTQETKSSPKKIAVVILLLLGGGVTAHFLSGGKSTKLINDLGRAVADSVPGPEADAKHRGEIYGRALGALFFDHGLIGSKSALGRVAKHDKIAKKLRKEAKHGILMPIITVILQRYVVFYRKALGYNGADGDVEILIKDLGRWRTETATQFEGFRDTDARVNAQEVLSAVLNIETFLETETKERWKAKWGPKLEAYEQDLAAFRKDAQTLGLEDLIKDHAPVIGHAMLMQLRVMIRSIKEAFHHMIEPVMTKDGSTISLFALLDMLGFDISKLEEAVQEFDAEMATTAAGFKK